MTHVLIREKFGYGDRHRGESHGKKEAKIVFGGTSPRMPRIAINYEKLEKARKKFFLEPLQGTWLC